MKGHRERRGFRVEPVLSVSRQSDQHDEQQGTAEPDPHPDRWCKPDARTASSHFKVGVRSQRFCLRGPGRESF